MAITYLQAKQTLSRYAGTGGTCAQGEKLDLFVKKVLQFMLYSGEHGGTRKFCFTTQKGCFTVPYELEAPLKLRIDGATSHAHNYWFEMYSGAEMENCVLAANALYEEPNYYSTVYDPPNGFCRIGVIGTADESPDASITIAGKDSSGREIITSDQGQQTGGEVLRIEKGKLHYTSVQFAEITSIKKSITNGYCQLLWVRPELNLKGFLSDYSPFEQVPEYRRFRITSPNCHPQVKVSVLGRIRLKEHYHDTDRIPFDNLVALELAGQAQNASYNNDPQMAAAHGSAMNDIISKEVEHKKVSSGSPMDVEYMLSAGAIPRLF